MWERKKKNLIVQEGTINEDLGGIKVKGKKRKPAEAIGLEMGVVVEMISGDQSLG